MENPFSLIADERRAFADTLATLSPEQWSTPSLCEGWSVKDVAVHVMVGPTVSMREVLVAMARSRFNFDRANRRLAAARAADSTQDVVDRMRAHADSRFTPPGMDWHAPLTDLFIHRLDVLVPLGLPTGRPLTAWQHILPFLLSPNAVRAFTGAKAPALTYRATDLEWTAGQGPVVEGSAEAIGAALCRRPALVDRLQGPGVEALRVHARG